MFRLFCAAILAVLLAGSAGAGPVPFSGFVGFGDSFSDKGRFGQLQPPSNDGRFTDGITWMEMLGGAFADRGLGNFNMALGGATAGPVNLNDAGYALVDSLTPRDPSDPDDIPLLDLRNLSAQVGSFAAAGFDALVGDNPLSAIFIGGNDLLQNPGGDPNAVIGSIVAGIRQIAALGPQFDSFLVANLPDSSLGPELFYAPQPVKDLVRAQTAGFNLLLSFALDQLAVTDGLEIEVLDLFGATDIAYAEAQAAGLILDDACTDSVVSATFDLSNRCFLPGSSANFLFIDNIHPGDFMQSRWGDAALTQMAGRLAPVPLPAGLPLLLGGLAGLAALRLRARARHPASAGAPRAPARCPA